MPFGIGKFNNSSNFDKGLSKNIGGGEPFRITESRLIFLGKIFFYLRAYLDF